MARRVGVTDWFIASYPFGVDYEIRTQNNGICRFDNACPGVILPERWNHIVGTYDGNGTIKLFLNGQECSGFEVVEPGCYGPIAHSWEPFAVGGSSASSGYIDEVRIYYEDLLASEIQRNYIKGLEKYKMTKK